MLVRKSKVAIIDARNTLWGKALAIAMAIIFAASTLMLAPLASAAYGEPEESVADEIVNDTMGGDENLDIVADIDEEEDGANDIVDREGDEDVLDGDNTVLDTQSTDEGTPEVQADENAVAQVGDVTYETLQEAITAVYYTDTKTATIKLLGDTEEAQVIVWAGCNITLDSNGHAINGVVSNYGNLVISGGKFSGIRNGAEGAPGTLTIYGGEFNTGEDANGFSVNAVGNSYGTAEIFGGTFTSDINGNPSVQNLDKMIIHNGDFSGCQSNGPAVTNSSFVNSSTKGDLMIYGGSFTGYGKSYANAAIQTINGSYTEIKGGSFAAQHTAAYVAGSGSHLKIADGVFKGTTTGAVYLNAKDSLLDIIGGEFTGGSAVLSFGGGFDSNNHHIIGGKYQKVDGSPWLTLQTKWLDEDIATQDNDGVVRSIYIAQVADNLYPSLQEAVDAIEGSGTITMVGDIKDMATADIVNIPAGKEIVLDMAGHSITVANGFSGRCIVNNGTLTVTGNGTIDASNGSDTGAYGAISNFGSLTIENGTFRGNSETNAANIRTYGQGSSLVINGGTFDTSSTAVLVYDSTATLNGGTYTTHRHNCSSCGDNWAYVVRTATDGGTPSLTINGGTYTGTQGALSTSTGYLEVNGGSFKTVSCENGHDSMFYALYAAGEAGDVKAVINGGTFENTGNRVAALLGNDNTNGDGGINADAISRINGGTFISKGDTAIKVSENTAKASIICGGRFSGISEAAQAYIDPSMQAVQGDDGFYTIELKEIVAQIGDVPYPTLEAAIEAAQDGDTVLLLKDVDAAAVSKTVTIDLGGNTINKIDVAGNGADKPGITATIYNGAVEIVDITNRGKILSNKIEIATVNATNGRFETNGGTYGTVNVTEGGNIHINNGTFDTVNADGANYASIKNGAFGTVTIKDTKSRSISGGTFDSFNDDLRKAVVIGKIVVKTKGGKFAVMNLNQVVAMADGWGYMSLDDAINAVKNGGTVELLKDNKVDTWNQIWDVKDVTINGNGKTLTVGKIESGANGNFLLYRAQGLVVNDLNIELNNGGAFDMTGGALDGVTVTGGRFAVSGGSDTTIKNCVFNGQSEMAIYTDDSQGAPGLVVDGCTFTKTRVGILRADEQITNCMVSGEGGWYQLTVVGTDATVTGNTFSGNDKALELYGQPADITKNNLENAGAILVGSDLDPAFIEADLSANYWGGEYPTDIDNVKIESYYTDAEMTNLVTITTESPDDDNQSDQGNQGGQGNQQPTTSGTNTPTPIVDDNTPLAPTAGPTVGTLATDGVTPAGNAVADETIDDDATPLAAADDEAAASETITDEANPLSAAQNQETEGSMLWVIVPVIVVAAGLILFLIGRRRKQREDQPYMRY